ncbi:kynurenine aminotransferase-like [Chrysoperla carnea]|uniref:kynurenine aminotransferase-like n=1 Tax=Chrysoperla carnea TaxID=189513 RepID=UPI001D0720E0|nr:kynurenine aminotransferase-like [Chrysoperla carnea]
MNWIIDFECLKNLFNNKTKLIIFSNPNYLLGKVYTKNELEFITNLCKKWNVLCVVDECLDSTVVHNKHIRMATLSETWNRTLTIGGSGVTYGRTGWKVAWVYGPEKLVNRIKVVHQLSFSSFTPVQETLARTIEKYGFEYFQSNYADNRDLLLKYLKKCGFRNIINPEGGYYIVVEINFKQNHQDVSNDYATECLTSPYGILGVPIINYGNENKSIFFCFSFAQKLETIQLAGSRLQSQIPTKF